MLFHTDLGAFDGSVSNRLSERPFLSEALVRAKHALATGSFPLLSQRSFFENRLEGSVLFIRGAGDGESVDAEL